MKAQILHICGVAVLLSTVACTPSHPPWHLKNLHAVAEQGDAQAQHDLGSEYMSLSRSMPDAKRWREAAVRWWRKAADKGNADAQISLGHAYWNGSGVVVDKREAVRWLRKAAGQGNADAQTSLGHAYWRGSGVVADEREAVRWFRRAAERGGANAQVSLGNIYWSAETVIADKREAYIWYSIAKANDSEYAAEKLRTFDWDAYFSKSEIYAAQREAEKRLEAIDLGAAIDFGAVEIEQETTIAENISVSSKPKDANTAAHVFENAWRSVVVVRNGGGQGSGVIVNPNIVATNCHVVNTYGRIAVYKANDRRADADTAFSATIRHADKRKDFCLLNVNGLSGAPVKIRKYTTLRVGENVYALGAPQGLDLSLSVGVISQLRAWGSNQFIQTDTAISPGSSGGGLFDREGDLIGILTAKIIEEGAEGIGFAIPADLVLGY